VAQVILPLGHERPPQHPKESRSSALRRSTHSAPQPSGAPHLHEDVDPFDYPSKVASGIDDRPL